MQFLKHKCAVTKLTKIALIETVFSFTQMLSLIEHKKLYKSFLGEDSRPSYFPQITYMLGNGKEGKIGASKAPQKRLEWENLIFFTASNANLGLLYIHDSQLHVLKQFL